MTEKFPTISTIFDISTHTLTWSVTQTKTENLDLKKNFNSHAHVERDFFLLNSAKDFQTHFNSHAHVERDLECDCSSSSTYNFNSHAHVERDTLKNTHIIQNIISTHTLTWSVTCNPRISIADHTFQLTRSRGA